MDERAILDKLRTEGRLPNDPDYQGWRARHLESYQLARPKELEPRHLPDGRTVQVIAAPAGPKGGVIYVFEDITDQLKLKSQHRAVLDVQRSTLNALSEAVAVFGTQWAADALQSEALDAVEAAGEPARPTTRISTRSPKRRRGPCLEDGAEHVARASSARSSISTRPARTSRRASPAPTAS